MKIFVSMLLKHTMQIFKNNVNNEIFTINNVILANNDIQRSAVDTN